jgi:hypothetical protein
MVEDQVPPHQNRLSIGDPKSRWGSCTPQRRAIRYSWRIVMAPPAVLDYLAAHEVAHLIRADHSPAFWAVVGDLIGDPTPHRRWLRDHGHRDLHLAAIEPNAETLPLVRAIGFSTSTSTPFSRNEDATSRCSLVGTTTDTASTLPSSSRWSA